MTNQEKKEFLGRYRNVQREIDRLKEEIRRWDAAATGGSASIAGVLGGRRRDDPLQKAVEEILHRRKELALRYGEAARVAGEIERAVDSLEEERLRLLLRYRYLEGMTFEQISLAMNYDVEGKNVYKLHTKALSLMKVDTELHRQPVL